MSDSEVRTIAACCGSGHSVLASCSANIWLTGEMSHHDVLNAVHNGTTVILCEHSNSERGFLQHLKTKLEELLAPDWTDRIEIKLAKSDRDPLTIV